MVNRKRGRPEKSDRVLSREEILERATRLILAGGREVGMREIARSFGVDPMALYHYFTDKGELYEALVIRLVDKIYRPTGSGAWRDELERLIASYLELLAHHRGLLGTVLRLGARAKGPMAIFRDRFEIATKSLGLTSTDRFTAMSAAVDFVHGFVVAVENAEEGAIVLDDARGSIRIIIAGIAALSRT